MIVEKLELTGELEEILGHRANPFPHSNFYVDCARYIGGYVPWHWHSDIEIFWVMQGTVKLTTSQGSYTIQQGEAVFLNSDTLHLQEPISPRPVLLTQVFDASLIAGTPGSVFAQKYVNPVLEAHQLDALIFQPVQPNHRHLINAIRQAYDLADLQEPGYEISVRNQLSEAWLTIFLEAQKQLHTKRSASSVGEERLKTMMQYIHSRYHEKISLADIAASASVSDREALRSFRRWLQKTPFQYLTEIRIRSARRLLRETTRQVTDIAYECGFSSPSYFGKVFLEEMGMTPLEYRKTSRTEGSLLPELSEM